jgi:hypothetical protein
VDQTRREQNKQVLDRIASDPKFREEILDDPKGAMERAGFKWDSGDDVTGYTLPGPMTLASGGGSSVSAASGCVPAGGGSMLATGVCDPAEGVDPTKETGNTVGSTGPAPQ